ncbi:hypothetical protein [Novosphingobium resinovorum]|uniref:hypothetical protein n=1 Tax=Novosphingobium resinovorum TaxID=158500 RepID=UPI002ECFB002|nr:hypothetical protein [Novosphingobium resinovorum]
MEHTVSEPTGTDYLGSESVTDVARMLMALASEVWIMRDRQIVTEYLLETKGSVTREDLDEFVPSGDLAAQITAERERFARLVAGAPIAAVRRSVPEILDRAGLKAPAPTN